MKEDSQAESASRSCSDTGSGGQILAIALRKLGNETTHCNCAGSPLGLDHLSPPLYNGS